LAWSLWPKVGQNNEELLGSETLFENRNSFIVLFLMRLLRKSANPALLELVEF
jgi:hypothetical protein